MTRTALYVSQDTTLVFSTNAPEDKGVEIRRYPKGTTAGKAYGAVSLQKGIYLIHSKGYVGVAGPGFEGEVHINDKDEWPDPPHAMVSSIESTATATQLKAFFRIALSADGPSADGPGGSGGELRTVSEE
jgi:hypothetical protein